jgi:FkbM family methyltransferase
MNREGQMNPSARQKLEADLSFQAADSFVHELSVISSVNLSQAQPLPDGRKKLGRQRNRKHRRAHVFSRIKLLIRDRLVRRFGVPEIPPALERLRINNFLPTSIFDVGAYSGEFSKLCRVNWPSAKLTCFEVLPHRVAELRSWCEQDGNAVVIETLLGAKITRAVPFHEMETASSVLEEQIPRKVPVRCFPMQTIDEVVRSKGVAAPDFLKLDVQGYELEVLKGAHDTLPRVSAVLAEVNLIDIHKGTPLLDELVLFMRDMGFVTYDICGLARRPLDRALWQADFIFVTRGSFLRSDKRWQP